MMKSMTAAGMIALFGMPALAEAPVRVVASVLTGSPDFNLPMSASQLAEARANAIIASILAEDYDLAADDTQDLDRIMYLTSFTDEIILSEEMVAIAATDESFLEDPLNDGESATGDMSTFLASPAGVGMMSAMSSGQIEAMTLLVMAMADPQAAREVLVSREIPDSGGNPGVDPQIRTSMLLRGWSVRMNEFGVVQMFQDSAPGTDIEIETGLVIGALGAVTDIRTIGQEVIVSFESGDTLSGAVLSSVTGAGRLSNGIPPLSDPDQAIAQEAPPPPPGEIMLSAPAAMAPEIATRSNISAEVFIADHAEEEGTDGPSPDTSGEAEVTPATPNAPVTSIRPEPNPRNRQD